MAVGYVGAALSSTMVRFFKKEDDTWDTQVLYLHNIILTFMFMLIVLLKIQCELIFCMEMTISKQ